MIGIILAQKPLGKPPQVTGNHVILQRKIVRILLIALMTAALAPGLPARAQIGSVMVPTVTGSVIRNNARITFEWPQTVKFNAEASGKKLTITFDRNVKPDFGALLSSMYPFITSVKQKRGGQIIVFTMDKKYKIRTFVSDNISGIDLLNIDPSKRRGVATANAYSGLMPAAGDASAPAEATNASEPATSGDSAAISATAGDRLSESVPSTSVKVGLSAADDTATLRLPFTERMGIAAFVRNNYLWVVLSKPMTIELDDFKNMPKTVIGKPEVMPGKKNVLRIPLVDDTVKPSVAKEENSFEWVVLLTSSAKTLANPLKVDINTDPPAPPHVFISSLEMGDAVAVKDPVVGDDLVIMPLFKPGEAIPFTRDFVEFTLPETAQGIMVAKKADAVSVQPLRNGLRISLPQGATLTPGLPEVEKSTKLQALQNVATLYPYKEWKPDETPSRRTQLNKLFQQSVDASSPQDANEHRLRIAQIYLSDGLAAESLSLLDNINRTSPIFYRSNKLAALHGAANFLMSRFPDAGRDFAAAELNGNKEMDYWRNMMADINGKLGQYSYLDMNDDYISKYPPAFRQKLAVVAADRAVETKDYNNAIKIFDSLKPAKDPHDLIASEEDKEGKEKKKPKEKEAKEVAKDKPAEDDLMGPINPYVNFLLAKILVDTGQLQEGLGSWNELAEDYAHPFVQARAEFSRIVWQLNHASLTKQQAIDRLERLRIVWHGDGLELKILALLGDLYFDGKDYVNAMRVWDDGVNSFPDTTSALEMQHRMEETFVLMFGDSSTENLSNMDALALYYQYRSYAPPGAVGRDMIGHLADRLIAMDLLDQAASLLEHQIRFEAEKVQRSQLGAKIATIHLLNHQPKKGLLVLQDSVYGENPAQLRQLRNRLAAQALYEQGENDRAWLILGQDDTADSDRIRLNIYWERKDYKQVINIVEAMLKSRKDINAPINLEESEYILKLGLAYIFENNAAQLQYLHDYFAPLMATNPNKAVFEFVTASDVAPNPNNFDEVLKSLSLTQSFLNNYRARIQASGLDAVVPPLPKKP